MPRIRIPEKETIFMLSANNLNGKKTMVSVYWDLLSKFHKEYNVAVSYILMLNINH